MQTDRPITPIFDLTDHYTATVEIGDQRLPIKVKRFSRAEMEAFEKKWTLYVVDPRGSDALRQLRARTDRMPPDGLTILTRDEATAILKLAEVGGPEAAQALADNKAAAEEREKGARLFFEETIREAITLDEGLVRDRGKWVTDGAGLIGVFHARPDVLGALGGCVCKQNRLTDLIRKNSNSLRDSVAGSVPSNPEASGTGPRQSAASADGSASATAVAATDASNGTDATSPASSGALSDGTQVH